jgi:hypothetical protein
VTFQVHVTEGAWVDVEETEDYFRDQGHSSLIPPFRADLMATLRFIAENPLLRSDGERPGIRTEHLTRFASYKVWFRVFEGIRHVEVFAVMNDARGDEAIERHIGS